MIWIIRKLPILIPVFLLLTLCVLGSITVLASNLANGFGIEDETSGASWNGTDPGEPPEEPIYGSEYCERVGDAGEGNPFSGFPTTDSTLQSAAYIGTDFCDPDYGFEWSHEGLDFLYWTGVPIASTGNGTVIYAGYDDGLGNMVVICIPPDWCARYGHMSSLSVSQGETVTAGQQIGLAGNSGGNTTGAHLHYDIYNGEGFWDPFPTLFN